MAMGWSSAFAPLRHVHEYTGHDHADHHHGVAAHLHARVPHAHRPAMSPLEHPALSRCDPGDHEIFVAFVCAPPEPDPVPLPIALVTVPLKAPEETSLRVAPSDVRSHGPPRLTGVAPRAPPSSHHV